MAVPQRSRSQRTALADDSKLRGAATEAPVATKPKRAAAKKAPAVASKKVAARKAAPRAASKPAKQPAQTEGSPHEATSVPFIEAAKAQVAANASAYEAAFEQAAAAFKMPGGKALDFKAMPDMVKQAYAQWMGQAGKLPGAMPDLSSLGSIPGLPAAQPAQQAAQAMGKSLGATLSSLAGLKVPPEKLQEIQQDYVQQATALWNQALEKPDQIKAADRRFAAPEWGSNPGSAFMASMYLLNARTLQRLADSLQGNDKACQRVRFAVQQWADAASPSNFLAFNPEVLKKAVETKGESLSLGMQHLMHDMRQGHMSQTDESVFEVGRNVANTAGTVVFENEYFQLIEYTPLTPKVHEVPFLFVPPCINKFYILDLQPDNSLVRYVLSQGHRVFMVSWVNADESLARATWDDYVEHGVMKAIDVTRDIAGVEQINALGFCVGGTLLATALATLAANGEKPVASLTLLTSFLDFADTGIMDVFVDEAMVRVREMSIGPDSPHGGGLMKGTDLAATFSFLRANDLVWNYVVGNYLKGETPPAFDLLYWNSDSTNLPGPFYTWYLRNTYLENKLCQPGAVNVCGVPLDMRKLDMPTFIYGSREDHIVPWGTAYASTQIVQGDKTFVLGASGHIAGVINPPEKKKRSYWVSNKLARRLPATAKEWLETAQEQPGSWWPVWAEWLAEQAGGMVAAPRQPGNRRYPAIEAAPGRYVLRKV
jgi:polyhydroxyalkanoate synthase